MATQPAVGHKKRASSDVDGPKYVIAVRVPKDLKDRVEAFATTYNLGTTEAVRTLLAFAVTEAEDPQTRVLYATFCATNAKLHQMLQDSLRLGMSAMHEWLVKNVTKIGLEQG